MSFHLQPLPIVEIEKGTPGPPGVRNPREIRFSAPSQRFPIASTFYALALSRSLAAPVDIALLIASGAFFPTVRTLRSWQAEVFVSGNPSLPAVTVQAMLLQPGATAFSPIGPLVTVPSSGYSNTAPQLVSSGPLGTNGAGLIVPAGSVLIFEFSTEAGAAAQGDVISASVTASF